MDQRISALLSHDIGRNVEETDHPNQGSFGYIYIHIRRHGRPPIYSKSVMSAMTYEPFMLSASFPKYPPPTNDMTSFPKTSLECENPMEVPLPFSYTKIRCVRALWRLGCRSWWLHVGGIHMQAILLMGLPVSQLTSSVAQQEVLCDGKDSSASRFHPNASRQ